MSVIAFAVVVLGLLGALPKWLRVAQREHYEPGRTTKIALLWIRRTPATAAVLGLGLLGVVGLAFARATEPPSPALTGICFAAVLATGLLWPVGLRWRGAPKPLVWTPRLRRLAVACGVVALVLSGVVWLAVRQYGLVELVVLGLLAPAVVDLGALVAAPVEQRQARVFLQRAERRLRTVSPRIIAITGSYGKTSTKNYVAAVLSATTAVVASPASYNNLLGLSRAVNDRLTPGTEVFIAEMGTYGPGEIRRLCASFPPSISCITSIGDVHLERMRTREVIAASKAEILELAHDVVLNVDYPELRRLADLADSSGKNVVRVSSDPVEANARVRVVAEPSEQYSVRIDDVEIGRYRSGGEHTGNVACAVGIAMVAGASRQAIADGLRHLPAIPHRAEVSETPSGAFLVDDTYNSNPDGAAAAFARAESLASARSKKSTVVVVTPGMVEMGSSQFHENAKFAERVTAAGGVLVIVGRTNSRALRAGAATTNSASERVFAARSRAEAATVAYQEAGSEGVILFENDLPDHYP